MSFVPLTAGGVAASALLLAVSLAAMMALAWTIWWRTGNSGWVDTVWTFGLGAVGSVGALAPGLAEAAFTERQTLVALLVAVWTLRLGWHIARRSAGIRDDPRYAKLVRDWGEDAPRQMFMLMQKQALVSVPLALSILLAAWNPAPGLRGQDVLAAVVLITAILGEALADRQLRQHRAEAGPDAICDVGLWGWSRHPNYFFQWLGWLAYPLFAVDPVGSYDWGWLALIGPCCMYWLLAHVSGIPPLEEHMLERRGEAYRDYQRRTSAFFPAPPREVVP